MFNFYLDYIRRMNNVHTGGEQARNTISQAYEFVISVVGVDKECGAIWADYLEFVKSSQVDVKWKEQQKMDQTITKLAPFQGTLGLIAIGLGVWMIVAGFLWTVG